jgi:hypothetical protein
MSIPSFRRASVPSVATKSLLKVFDDTAGNLLKFSFDLSFLIAVVGSVSRAKAALASLRRIKAMGKVEILENLSVISKCISLDDSDNARDAPVDASPRSQIVRDLGFAGLFPLLRDVVAAAVDDDVLRAALGISQQIAMTKGLSEYMSTSSTCLVFVDGISGLREPGFPQALIKRAHGKQAGSAITVLTLLASSNVGALRVGSVLISVCVVCQW